MSRRLVLATRNEHKVYELRQILAAVCRDLDLEIVGASDFPEVPDVAETEVTFAGNARLKAQAPRGVQRALVRFARGSRCPTGGEGRRESATASGAVGRRAFSASGGGLRLCCRPGDPRPGAGDLRGARRRAHRVGAPG